MKIVALLTVRNEELYIERCINHLNSQGVEVYLIDNGSTDDTVNIAKKYLGKGMIAIENIPYNGRFEWLQILRNKERLASEIEADWLIHYDADEIREAPPPYMTLREGIMEADKQGYNAINFDEFVFIPTKEDGSFEGRDYLKEMKYYYFFEQRPMTQIKAWKKSAKPVSLATSGGHRVDFEGRNIFPVNFIMRHYIALSIRHLIEKYSTRVYSEKEVKERGWHKDRAGFDPLKIALPKKEQLKEISDKGVWDRSDPWNKHKFLGFSYPKRPKPGKIKPKISVI
jgi:glycosyltransferase involved in cell wall biosynthesis